MRVSMKDGNEQGKQGEGMGKCAWKIRKGWQAGRKDGEKKRWGSTGREKRWSEKEVGVDREENSAFELFKVNSFYLCIDPRQKVCTISKHPQLLRSSMQRGGQVWEAGLVMPRGTESPSPSLLADKSPTLIMCNVIVPPLPLEVGT